MISSTNIYNDITSPFDKPWDLSQKDNQEYQLVASKAAGDHVRFDVSVATAKTFLELLKDKSEYYGWGLHCSFDSTKAKLAKCKDAM